MNRRSFLAAIGSLLAAPALPRPVLAAPLARAVPASVTAYGYGLAVFHARTRGSVSVGELAAKTGVARDQAADMITRLLSEQHIVPSGVAGRYTAANPYLQNPALRDFARKLGRNRKRASHPRWREPDLTRIVAYLRNLTIPTLA